MPRAAPLANGRGREAERDVVLRGQVNGADGYGTGAARAIDLTDDGSPVHDQFDIGPGLHLVVEDLHLVFAFAGDYEIPLALVRGGRIVIAAAVVVVPGVRLGGGERDDAGGIGTDDGRRDVDIACDFGGHDGHRRRFQTTCDPHP